MLENENVVALNNVILSCREAASRYHTASTLLDEGSLKKVFTSFADYREDVARRLEAAVKRLGSLPMDTNPDKQTLEMLWTRIKSAVENDKIHILLTEGFDLEENIIDACDHALACPLEEDLTRTIARLKRESATCRQWFKDNADLPP
ncbi:MAG: DUF2383 domain-containing protein [Desulfobacterales bacterium]